MKKLVEHIVKLRNPNFTFDDAVSGRIVFEFLMLQLLAIFRGLKVIFSGKKPNYLLLGKKVQFQAISRISWGKFLKLGDNVLLSGLGKKGLFIGNNVGIGAHSRVIVSTSLNNLGEAITIGNNVGIGEFAYLGGAGGLTIGNDCIVGQYFSCHPENHIFTDLDTAIRLQGVTRKGIKIGNNCWIGSKVTILDGAEIGDDCVIAAGAVVNRSFAAGSIIGGVPAKLLKTR